MRREESRYPQDWFRIGERELRRAENLLGIGDLEGAGFNIQQAVEKYLKGYLLGHGWALRRIHDLETLLNEAVALDPRLDEFREACRKMTQYYVEERYPFTVSSELTRAEVEESLAAAKQMIERLRSG